MSVRVCVCACVRVCVCVQVRLLGWLEYPMADVPVRSAVRYHCSGPPAHRYLCVMRFANWISTAATLTSR